MRALFSDRFIASGKLITHAKDRIAEHAIGIFTAIAIDIQLNRTDRNRRNLLALHGVLVSAQGTACPGQVELALIGVIFGFTPGGAGHIVKAQNIEWGGIGQ